MLGKTKFYLAIVLMATIAVNGENECKSCMNNGAYCVDETSFKLCIDATNTAEEVHKCPTDKVCSNADAICVPKSQIDGSTTVNVCEGVGGGGTDGSCGVCQGRYACVSARHFSFCINGETSDVISKCEVDTFCSTQMFANGPICAPQSVLDFFEYKVDCSNSEPSTTTRAPTKAPDMDKMKAYCFLGKPTENNKAYFYVANDDDNTCKSYIYCEEYDGRMEAILFRCETGYYDADKQKCTAEPPARCGTPTTTTPLPEDTTPQGGSGGTSSSPGDEDDGSSPSGEDDGSSPSGEDDGSSPSSEDGETTPEGPTDE